MIIVHIQTRWLNAGSEENILSSCRHQMQAGHQVFALVGRDPEPRALAKLSATVTGVIVVQNMVHEIAPVLDFKAVMEMKSVLARLKPDVVHTHQSKAGVLGRMAARLARAPTIVHGIHIVPFENVGRLQQLIYLSAEWFCAWFTSGYISVSPSVRDAYLRRWIGAPSQHFVALSAMEISKFRNPEWPSDWRDILQVGPNAEKPPTVVMMAAFEPRKRQLELIAALPEAFRDLEDWRLLFVGEGTTEARAREAVKSLGLEDKVHFSGFRDDPERMIALADVCLLTSVREGLPRVIVQYAAAGKPIVVSELLGLDYVLQNGKSAIITASEDVAAAAAAAARLLGDRPERDRLSKGTESVPVQNWAPECMNASIDRAYQLIGATT